VVSDAIVRTRRGSLSKALALSLFWLIAVTTVYPLVWLAINSFKTSNEMFDNTWLLPQAWQWHNYLTAWTFGIQQYLVNSVIVTITSVALIVFISALAAYALTVLRFPGRGGLFLFILCGSILPPEVSLFPLFKILVGLHLYDTYGAMIVPYVAFGLPFTTFLIRAYMVTVPYELHEAASIDGAGPFRSFWNVYLPLCRPVLASAALIQAMRVWNEFIFALTFVETEGIKTLTVGVATFGNALRNDWAVLMAGLVISIVPILFAFLVMQRQFMGGLTQGAVK
jgi:raffinose/stachyose/melibiose transport system permease protein